MGSAINKATFHIETGKEHKFEYFKFKSKIQAISTDGQEQKTSKPSKLDRLPLEDILARPEKTDIDLKHISHRIFSIGQK